MNPTLAPSLSFLRPWVDGGVFGPAELHATEVVTRADQTRDALVQLGAAFALWAPLHGHVCIALDHVESLVRSELANQAEFDGLPFSEINSTNGGAALALELELPWPTANAWLAALAASPIVRVVDRADTEPVLGDQPLVLCRRRLYTQRQWVDECIVAASLRARATAAPLAPLSPAAAALLDSLLPPTEDGDVNLQHDAAHLALQSRLAVVVGGPGTGKTHTVARMLAVLLANAAERGEPVRIALGAPTGKAAARLTEAILAAAAQVVASGDGGQVLPAGVAMQLVELRATTVHRLLGSSGMSRSRFLYNASNPLPYDIVVVDETSMMALPLMARLVEAVSADARLVLVGDPDQLESIDVGAVLADIYDAATNASNATNATNADLGASAPLSAHVVRLRRPRRQQQGSPIAPLADAIREGRADDVLHLLRAGSVASDSGEALLTFIDTGDALRSPHIADIRAIVSPALVDARAASIAGDADTALRLLAHTRVLCAHRRGPYGTEQWNRTIESWMLGPIAHPRDYPGRALLVTRNDPRTNLSNGDTGIVVMRPDGVRAAFHVADSIREFSPSQIEGIETAFAMTIHKSQGSEYATVIVVLPPATSPLIGRELLYTAVTRTTRRLFVVGSAAAVTAAVLSPARRVTGLTEALS